MVNAGMADTISAEFDRKQSVIDCLCREIDDLKADIHRLRALDSLKTISLSDSPTWQTIGAYAEVKEENARLKAEVERLKDALNKFAKTPDGVDGVKVDVSFWTKSGSRLPSSYSTFWMNTDIGIDSLTSPKSPAGGSDDTGGMDGQTDSSKRL
jgi:hypothetical protein